MKKADKDKVAKGFRDEKGKRVRVEMLLPTKLKKKLVTSIEPKERKL